MDGIIASYDVKLNGKKYLVMPGSYNEGPVSETVQPFRTGGGDPESRSSENPAWAFMNQSIWRGEGVDDWREGLGGFCTGYGLDISRDGEVGPAHTLVQTLNDTTNPDGYLIIPFSSTLVVAIGKTTGRTWTSPDKTNWTQRNYVSGGIRATNAWAFYKAKLCVSDSAGKLWTTTDGITWASFGITEPSATSAYVLGVYRSKMYVAWGGDVRTWDGTTLTVLVTLDGTPVAAAVGSGAMFIIAQGTPSHLYMASGDQLVELLQWPSDFQSDAVRFTDTLYISGGSPDASGGWTGEVWRYSQNGIELIYEDPQTSGAGVDYRIRSLATAGMDILFSKNKLAAVGTYDGTYDQWQDPILGFATGSITSATPSGASQVIGLLNWQGATIAGIAGHGLYTESGFCDWQLTSSLFGSSSKRRTKLWGFAEVTHSALQVGQSLKVEYSLNGTTWTTLGTKVYAASYTFPESGTKSFFTFPTQLLSPVLQYRVTATCNNADLSLLDISFSFIGASANPKRHWTFVIGLGGSSLEPMKYRDDSDFERSSPTMKAELDALWNTQFSFEDIFGNTYTTMMPGPSLHVEDVVKQLNAGDKTTVESVLADYRVTLVEV